MYGISAMRISVVASVTRLKWVAAADEGSGVRCSIDVEMLVKELKI